MNKLYIKCLALLLGVSLFAPASTKAQQIVGAPYDASNLTWNTSDYKSFKYIGSPGVGEMTFRILYPIGYNPAADLKYPVILMLHGRGEAQRKDNNGNYIVDNNYQLLHGGREHNNAVKNGKFNGFVIFPQSQYGYWVSNKGAPTDPISVPMRKVLEMMEYLPTVYDMDLDKMYIHGLSGGAEGVWDALWRRPDLFAAALPMSNAGHLSQAENIYRNPIWVFQGELDNAPRPFATEAMIAELQRVGGTPRYTKYANVGHSTWYKAYAEPDFFSWMTSKNKTQIHTQNGRMTACPGNPLKIGISPGYLAYEWSTGATTNDITVTAAGTYSVRMKRYNGTWTTWGSVAIGSASGCSNADATPPSAPANLTASGVTSSSVNLSWNASTDNVGVSGYNIYQNNTMISSVAGTSYTVTGLTASSSYSFYVRAKDASNNLSNQSNTVNVTTLSGGGGGTSSAYRINAGGPAITSNGITWAADTREAPSPYLDPASSNNTAGPLSWSNTNTTGAPNAIFGPYRYDGSWGGEMMYNFPVTNGTYTVNLYFAENSSVNGAAQRRFDVYIEGVQKLNDFDMYAESGYKAIKKSFTVNVTDGKVDIDFKAAIGLPLISGIEIMTGSALGKKGPSSPTDTTFLDVHEAIAEGETSLDTDSLVNVSVISPKIYPNPVTGSEFSLLLPEGTSGEVLITIYDQLGRELYQVVKNTDAGLRFNFDMSVIPVQQGVFFVSVSADKGEQVIKVLKK